MAPPRSRRARRAGRRLRLFPGHGRAAGGHQVPRRLRTAPEGGAQAAQGKPQGGAVHRRDPYAHRRRCGIGRHAGCVQPAQAGPVLGPVEVHRRDHLYRIPGHLREGPRVVAALPEDRRQRTQRRADRADPARPEAAVRGPPQRQVFVGGAVGGGRTVGQVHQRPPPAGQGHRRHRRGRRGPAHPAQVAAEESHRQGRDRGHRVQDRPDPAAVRLQRRSQQAGHARARPEGRGVRPGRRHRCAVRVHQDGALGAGQARQAHRRLSVLRAHWPSSWASSCCASTCPSTWSAMRCRA